MDVFSSLRNGIIYSACLALISCAPKPVHVDPALFPYVEAFEKIYNIKYTGNVYLSNTRTKGKESRIGYCASGWEEIHIDKDYWLTLTEPSRIGLMFHELAHCTKGTKHNDKLLDNGCPVSLMHSMIYPNCLNLDIDYYIKQLHTELR